MPNLPLLNADRRFWKETSPSARSGVMGKRKQFRPKTGSPEAHHLEDTGVLNNNHDSMPSSTASSSTLPTRKFSSATSVGSSDSGTGITNTSNVASRSASLKGPQDHMSLAERIRADERHDKAVAIVRHLEMMEEQRLDHPDGIPSPQLLPPASPEQSSDVELSAEEDGSSAVIESDQPSYLGTEMLRLEVDLGEPLSAQHWFQPEATGLQGSKESSQTTPTISTTSICRTSKTKELDDNPPGELSQPIDELFFKKLAPDVLGASAPEDVNEGAREKPNALKEDIRHDVLVQDTIAELQDLAEEVNSRARSESTPAIDSNKEVASNLLDQATPQGSSDSQRTAPWPQRSSSMSELYPKPLVTRSKLQPQITSGTSVREGLYANKKSRLSTSKSFPSLKQEATTYDSSSLSPLHQTSQLVPIPSSPAPSSQLPRREADVSLPEAVPSYPTRSPPPPPPLPSPPTGIYELSTSPSVVKRRPVQASADQVQQRARSRSNHSAYNTLSHQPFPIPPRTEEQADMTEDSWKLAFRDIYTRHSSTPKGTQLPEVRIGERTNQDALVEPDVDPRTGKKWVQNKAMTWTQRVPEVEHVTGISREKG